jgi:hypothetical protein
MRKAFLFPPVVLGLCLGLCGCGGDPAERAQKENNARAEDLADIEERFQTSAEIAEHRAEARKAAQKFLEESFFRDKQGLGERCAIEGCKVHGLHSSLAEGGTYRIAADVGIGKTREIFKLEAIRFFASDRERDAYWQVVVLSATSQRVIGDPVNIQRLRTLDAPKDESPSTAAPARVEPTPTPTAQP